ncbi:hypothetical protein FP2506_08036 [Fulvimarina pelagi HTCC2506]|uniref:Uncharacterized protein n=1 Tax=Fulvimarina pelagi HTCC2506 TaxID=314231 RepID=Q0G6D9_9HYPH|nr:hypothetical protein FP2506_08036 [Fulvimarina pelagi HTCC2506]
MYRSKAADCCNRNLRNLDVNVDGTRMVRSASDHAFTPTRGRASKLIFEARSAN